MSFVFFGKGRHVGYAIRIESVGSVLRGGGVML